ncbi:mannitol dehydrogenase family protein [Acidovorax sp. Be4]|uniref:Mannitol dehydrogenase family protein n=1 Tax=Acidovorax bellezanensis TaxID=2976702 RepID=A0ABT2PNU6_9BURK|nr:mannitol dehydrogenase family protein [Acidovorax sp. Be4]MCT9812145.1 mannitol dehydrogenase family protein [Acidovorax sp. Be4]
MAQAILQFGTSRFLQAHVDLFVHEALAGVAGAGDALGGITVVQTTDRADGAARIAALAAGGGYPVRIRGLAGGERIDRSVMCTAVREAWQASSQWPALRAAVEGEVQVIVSNTADKGYLLDERDGPSSLAADSGAPHSFPAKLLVLLHGRWQSAPQAPLTLLPCELIERNGEVLRDVVAGLARDWQMPQEFIDWLSQHCVWANSLVDRIVSEAIEPVGAVAEPYAAWVVERQARLVLPCTHPAILLTDNLAFHERLKLFLLNAGHTWLAERWLSQGLPAGLTVREAMADDALRGGLEALWAHEILPVFDTLGAAARQQAEDYLVDVRERFANPFLDHRIADIAQNHAQKKQRRLGPIVALAAERAPQLSQPGLKAALASPL